MVEFPSSNQYHSTQGLKSLLFDKLLFLLPLRYQPLQEISLAQLWCEENKISLSHFRDSAKCYNDVMAQQFQNWDQTRFILSFFVFDFLFFLFWFWFVWFVKMWFEK